LKKQDRHGGVSRTLAERKTILVSVLLAIVFIPCVQAAAQGTGNNRPGAWHGDSPLQIQFSSDVSATARTQSTIWIRQIVSMLHAVPALSRPTGFDVYVHASAELVDEDGEPQSKRPMFVAADITLDMRSLADDSRLGSVQVTVNNVAASPASHYTMDAGDAQGRFLANPIEMTNSLYGHPAYEDWAEGSWVFIARKNVPVYANVSSERVLKIRVAKLEQQATKRSQQTFQNPTNDPRVAAAVEQARQLFAMQRQSLDAANQQLAAMTADQRAKPAIVSNAELAGPNFEFSTDPDAIHIRQLNPELLDTSVPAWQPQIVQVRIGGFSENLSKEIQGKLDWVQLDKLVR
jgi:hypothetical protein